MTVNDKAWIESLFASIDAMDTPRFITHLRPDAEFQFGNFPPIRGSAEIAAMVGNFFESLRGLKHTVIEHWTSGDTLVCRGTVTYFRHQGSDVSVPFANIMRLDGEQASEYRIYADVSPLFG